MGRGNLPAPPTALVGRARELAEIVDLVRSRRLVTLTGAGGVGKTRLALEVGAELDDEFPDGVWFVELAAIGDAESVPDAIATVLGIPPQADVPMSRAAAESLSGRRLLLVLDNCEHVIDAAADAADTIHTRTSSVTVLATSREGLRVRGEHQVVVPPLDLDGGVSSPAVTLFVARARAVDPGFEMDDSEAVEAVTEICRGLDGLALGIELAAARMVSMTPVDLQHRLLADRFRMLTVPARGSERQRNLRQTVGWSYDLLNDDERVVLRHASVFSGGLDLDALTEVVGDTYDAEDVFELMDSLVRKSLVTASHDTGSTRYSLLEIIRQYVEHEVAATGLLDEARDRHATYFARAVMAQWAVWNGPTFRETVDWVEREFSNLRAAFRWSFTRSNHETAADIAAHAAMMGFSVQLFESVAWAEEIIEAATAADLRRLPRVLTAAGYCCFTGRPEQAIVYAQAAARLEADPSYEPFDPGWAGLIEALAQVYAGHLDRYVEITRGVAALLGSARAFGLPALLDGLQATGRVDEAMDLVDETIAATLEQGNPFWIAYALWARGSVYAHVDPVAASTAWREGLTYVRQHRVHFFEGFIARDAARLELVDPDPDEALTLADAAITSFLQAGNVAQLTITLASVTSLFERIDQLETASTLYGAITCQPGSDHHAPDLPDVALRLASKLGQRRFDEHVFIGAGMNLSETAHYARSQIELARAQLAARANRRGNPGGLSRREIDVLELMTEGLTTREIAERLFISPKTADHHIQHVYTKIGVSNRASAAVWAMEHNVIG